MKKLKRVCSVMLSLVLALGLLGLNVSADDTSSLDIAKTATELTQNDDGDYISNVTLTIPSVEENEEYDIVFVLDKSTSPSLQQQAVDLLKDLQDEVSGSGAVINVGVVVFNMQATTFGFYDLETEFDEINTAIYHKISSGTNTHAGLLAAQALLDGDSDVDAENKYMIFVSDGITYIYDEDPTYTAWAWSMDGSINSWTSPDNWGSKYSDTYIPDDWANFLESVGKQYTSQQNEKNSDGYTGYEDDYSNNGSSGHTTDSEKYLIYVNSVEIALYKTYTVYQEMVDAGYNCYSVVANTGSGGQYKWGPSFMEFLANGDEVTFEDIENEIMYFVDSGSTVVDYMGYVEDDYDFDFVDDASYLTLSVGSTVYEAVDLGDSTYGFKEVTDESGNVSYAFKLVYEKGNGTDDEKFTLYINEAITYFNPVKLTYSVILTNPKTEAGTYGTYDEDGSEGYDGLYTNNSATLYPVDTEGNSGEAIVFPMPTVSYTVNVAAESVDDPETPETPATTEESIEEEADEEEEVETETSDHTVMYIYALLGISAACGAYYVTKRKEEF